jgi:hypothetical protein
MPLQLRASLLAALAISMAKIKFKIIHSIQGITSLAVRAIPFLMGHAKLDLGQFAVQFVLILAMNLNGMFIVGYSSIFQLYSIQKYIPTELVQRRTFRETRKSVENRIQLVRDNEKQENIV